MLMLKIRQLIFVVKLHNQEQIDCSPGLGVSTQFREIVKLIFTLFHPIVALSHIKNRCVRRIVNHQAKILKAMGAFNQVNAFSEYCENFANFR